MPTDYDVVVLGAGFTGLYATHKFRDDLGLSVKGFDPAEGPGGVWYWNTYPGARCDFESVYYSYSFSEDISREWTWSEKYAAQPEIRAYLDFVADRLDLRRSFSFGVSADSLAWDDAAQHWKVHTSDGGTTTARFIASGIGGLSLPKAPDFPGAEDFTGELYSTNRWPQVPVDVPGKRVGVIGTGSSGIQVIQEVAKTAGELVVFQRTANFATPMNNIAYDASAQQANAEGFARLRAAASPVSGADLGEIRPSVFAEAPEEVTANLDAAWERGGLGMAFASYADIHYDPAANEVVSDYIRARIRGRVNDPAVAELLCPTDHPYVTKRPPLESNYYEVYNQDNVTLVDVRTTPIERLTERGLSTTAADYDLDVVILALGFDAFSGAQMALPMTGRDGVTLQQRWSDGPLAYLGMAAHGFPNYFQFATGPSAASQHNTVPLIEHQVDFAAAAIETVRASGATTIEPTAQADAVWKELCDGLLPFTLLERARSTWYLGHNIPGKKPAAYAFYAGSPYYHALMAQTQHGGWGGFQIDGLSSTELPSLARLDPGAANFVGAMMMSGAPSLEEVPLEGLRAQLAGQGAMQVPGPELHTLDIDSPRARLYLPGGDESKPVVVFYHGGGFVAGNTDSLDPVCRSLATDLGAIVVSVDYRLAPEHPFPAAVNDAIDAVHWVAGNITAYGGDPSRIAVMGESAGATLATVAARRAAEEGLALSAQVLIYPVVDGEAETDSKKEFFHGPFLSVPAGDRFWKLYMDGHPVTEDAAPLRATDLSGLAPAQVLTMEIDPLRDEGEAYARRLIEAGVPTEHHRLEGLIHGSYGFGALIPRTREIHEHAVRFLTTEFQRDPASLGEGHDGALVG